MAESILAVAIDQITLQKREQSIVLMFLLAMDCVRKETEWPLNSHA